MQSKTWMPGTRPGMTGKSDGPGAIPAFFLVVVARSEATKQSRLLRGYGLLRFARNDG
jgi:hypothetical protein